jgi:hypothetical protein
MELKLNYFIFSTSSSFSPVREITALLAVESGTKILFYYLLNVLLILAGERDYSTPCGRKWN